MSDQVPAQEHPQGHKVFAGNLAYSVTDDALKAFFAPIENDIISAQVIMRGTRSAGYGFVTVKTLEAAQSACDQLDKKDFEGRQVVVEVAKPSEEKDKERAERRAKRRAGRARGRAPPGEVSEAEANGDAEKADAANGISGNADGEEKRKSKKKRFPRKKGKRADERNTAEGAESAPLESDVPAKKPRVPRVKPPSRAAGEEPQGEPSKTVLFVANLGFNIDDAGLAQLFKDEGINVVSARIVRRRWGKPRRSKGYGFVDVGGEDEQKKAIASLEGKEIDGRQLAVKVAVNAGQDDKEEATAANGTEAV